MKYYHKSLSGKPENIKSTNFEKNPCQEIKLLTYHQSNTIEIAFFNSLDSNPYQILQE